jgi:hypothetical protein
MESLTLTLALSLHLGLEGDYNSIHPHLRYTTDNYIAGAYYNSESNLSTYIGKRWEHNDFGLEAGAVTGYSQADIMPYVRGTYKDFFVAPAVEGDDTIGAVIGYELKW